MTKDILKQIIKERGLSYQTLADKLGYKTKSGLSERIYAGNKITVANLIKILNALDCDLVIQSKTKDKSSWVIK